jgi:hypothetical protein
LLEWRGDGKGYKKKSSQGHLACKLAIFVLLGRRGTSAIYLRAWRKTRLDLKTDKEPGPGPPFSPLHHPDGLVENVLGRETPRRIQDSGGMGVAGDAGVVGDGWRGRKTNHTIAETARRGPGKGERPQDVVSSRITILNQGRMVHEVRQRPPKAASPK